jgi:hypothetical protein
LGSLQISARFHIFNIENSNKYCLYFLLIIIFIIQGLATVTEENVEKAMTYFAIAWLLYGLHGVSSEKMLTWPEGLEPATSTESTIGGIVSLVFSVFYFMLRKPNCS